MNHPFRPLFVEVPTRVDCDSCLEHTSFMHRKIYALEVALSQAGVWLMHLPETIRELEEVQQRLTFELYKATTK